MKKDEIIEKVSQMIEEALAIEEARHLDADDMFMYSRRQVTADERNIRQYFSKFGLFVQYVDAYGYDLTVDFKTFEGGKPNPRVLKRIEAEINDASLVETVEIFNDRAEMEMLEPVTVNTLRG